jgi:hypothetical protein
VVCAPDIATGLSLVGDALESTDVDDEYIVGYRQSKHLLDLGGLVDLEPRVLFPVGPA